MPFVYRQMFPSAFSLKYGTIIFERKGDAMSETIAAIATPLAEGAISIIRISGDDAISVIDRLFDHDMTTRSANTITYGFIIDPDTGERIDEVLVSLFRKPHSYTGEDVVEINCHGGVYVTKAVLRLVLGTGARLARPGEFSERAFLNGRIDLTQAEAVMDLIKAKDQTNAQMALNGIRGSVKQLLTPLIDDILDIIANIEVNIDYPEYEDVIVFTQELLLPKTEAWLRRLDTLLEHSQSGQIVKEGIPTAIVGKPNVGKSSLLNALLEEEKAIVSEEEGTTRDVVEGSITLKGITLHLIDTAGIRKTDNKVEQIGIKRSMQMMDQARLVLLVLDASLPPDETDRELMEAVAHKPHLLVYNKADLAKEKQAGICVSARNGDIEALLAALNELYAHHVSVATNPVLNNERQIGCLRRAKHHMLQARDALRAGVACDLAELDIQEAYRNLKEILGEYHREDLLDALFSNFCLGK